MQHHSLVCSARVVTLLSYYLPALVQSSMWRLVKLCLCLSCCREVGAVMVEVLGRFGWRIVGMVN